MIIVPAIISEDNTAKPEYIPENLNFGSHFDGQNFCFFQSQEDAQNFYNSTSFPTIQDEFSDK